MTCVPNGGRVGGFAEDFVAAFAGVAGARNHHRAAKQLGLQVVEVRQLADARHMLAQVFHRQRALQRQVVQVVVKQHRHVAPQRAACEDFMALARAVDHHESVGAVAVNHAIVNELARFVEHAGVDRFAGVQLAHVARGGLVDDHLGVRADDMHLLQARHVHQPRLGADGFVFVGQVGAVSPGRAHAVPVGQA